MRRYPLLDASIAIVESATPLIEHSQKPAWRMSSEGELPASASMTMIRVMSETRSLADVKARFSEMVDRVEHQHDRITVTRNGRPAAVLMSPDDLAALEDTLELLSDPAAMAEIVQARREAAAGEYVSADELRAKYLNR